MKMLPTLLITAVLILAGCGGDDETPGPSGQLGQDAAMETRDAATTTDAENPKATTESGGSAPAAKGTTVTIGDSEFGEMLFDAKEQAIYIFENDPKGETVCYDECAEAWPPVFTEGEPVAGKGVDASLLGTVKRRDGRLQVTYADQPLYFYAHEQPGRSAATTCTSTGASGG